MKKNILLIASICLLFVNVSFAKVNIISSSTDLASIASEIGGDKVSVKSIAKGRSNLHYVEILPSYMLKVSKADVYLKIGLKLDYWADAIIDGSRNNDLVVVDCSENIVPLETISGKIDASMGDVHPEGNPHYWLNPENGKIIAENIYNGLIKADPDNASYFKTRLDEFNSKLESKILEWKELAAPLEGLKLVSYHNTWPYFCQEFNFDVVGFIEPKPGIEPTASHTTELIKIINNQKVGLIIKEPHFSDKAPRNISENSGAVVLELSPSVGGNDNVKTYFDLFDFILNSLEKEVKS